MNKTINANIAGIVFNIEEDAYIKLDQYLKSVKSHFASIQNSDEIIADIEARAAEHFLNSSGQSKIVTLSQVENLITQMGKVEDFDDAQTTSKNIGQQPQGARPNKKLFRNPDDKIIAGVASGVATYFGIEPLWMRIVFFLLLLTGGFMIPVYLLLWLFLPEAKTPTDKIQMRGEPVNLNDVQENVKKRVEELKQNNQGTLNSFVKGVGRVIRFVVVLFASIIGVFIALGALAAVAGATFAAINLAFNANSEFIQFPLAVVTSGPLYYLVIVLGYVLALIPLAIIIMAGVSFISRKNLFSYKSTGALVALWFVAAMAAGFIAVRYAPEWGQKIRALPEYQVTTKQYDIKDFTKLDLHGVDEITLVQGTEYSVSAEGRGIDLEQIEFTNEDNTLVLNQRDLGKICFFCDSRDRMNIEITMPNIESIEISGFNKLEADQIKSENLNLKLTGVSSAEVAVSVKNLNVELSGNSTLDISGNADKLIVEESGVSEFLGFDLLVNETKLELSGSSDAEVNSKNTLDIIASGSSEVRYIGAPKITEVLSGQSEVAPANRPNEISDPETPIRLEVD